MKYLASVATLCFTLVRIIAFAQDYTMQRMYDVPVTVNGQQLLNPWGTGLNSCQVSDIDLNFDGLMDLFVFDRIGNRICTYVKIQNGNGFVYKYTREFNSVFPAGMKNWVLLRDFNCDGQMDIFTNKQSGLVIYKNIGSSQNGLAFEAVNNGDFIDATFDFGASVFDAPVYTIAPDIPCINDYDHDGDMDIFSYGDTGTSLFFFKCMQVENGDCNTPAYICANRCYGMFNEATESFNLNLGNAFQCDFNVVNPRDQQERMHVGSTVLQIDLDQNGIEDLIIGDVSNPNLAALTLENAVSGLDSAASVQLNFPHGYGTSDSVSMQLFPAAYYVDVDNDNIKDLLASPNALAQAQDRKSLVLFKNNGANNLPSFEFIQKDFLQEDQIDLGISAYPVVFDVDQDGLKDLLVTNKLYLSAQTAFTSQAWYFKNTGTITAPAFTLVDTNWLNLPSLASKSFYLTFGDLNGDLASDLVVGDEDGYLHYFQNTAQAGSPCNFVLVSNPVEDNLGNNIDVGQNATPFIADLDDDGLNDLIVGEKNGGINFYRNTGTPENYNFVFEEDSIGQVVGDNYLGINGYSVPFLFKNDSGQWQLLVGSETGKVALYDDIEGNISGQFHQVTDNFANVREGDRCGMFLADMNGDGLRDYFYGQIGGGLGYYQTISVGVNEVSAWREPEYFPNPCDKILSVRSNLGNTNLAITDLSGRLIYQTNIHSGMNSIDVSSFPQGYYMIRLSGRGIGEIGKLAIVH